MKKKTSAAGPAAPDGVHVEAPGALTLCARRRRNSVRGVNSPAPSLGARHLFGGTYWGSTYSVAARTGGRAGGVELICTTHNLLKLFRSGWCPQAAWRGAFSF
jgi:hypothetical protein